MSKSSLKFLREYCRNVKEIGSVVPDSKACVESLLRGVPFGTAGVIVEFGAASGAVTRELIRRKRPETLLVSFEKNPALYRSLKQELAAVNFCLVNEDAFNCRELLEALFRIGERDVDCIISTLPCSCLDFDGLMRRAVLPVLKGTGRFVQYMHSLSLLKGFHLETFLHKYFDNLQADFVWRNIPPAFVYTGSNPGGGE